MGESSRARRIVRNHLNAGSNYPSAAGPISLVLQCTPSEPLIERFVATIEFIRAVSRIDKYWPLVCPQSTSRTEGCVSSSASLGLGGAGRSRIRCNSSHSFADSMNRRRSERPSVAAVTALLTTYSLSDIRLWAAIRRTIMLSFAETRIDQRSVFDSVFMAQLYVDVMYKVQCVCSS